LSIAIQSAIANVIWPLESL